MYLEVLVKLHVCTCAAAAAFYYASYAPSANPASLGSFVSQALPFACVVCAMVLVCCYSCLRYSVQQLRERWPMAIMKGRRSQRDVGQVGPQRRHFLSVVISRVGQSEVKSSSYFVPLVEE
jgi:hypothetical protein